MFGAIVLIPQLAQTPASSGYGFGADATRAGLLMVPGCLIMLAAQHGPRLHHCLPGRRGRIPGGGTRRDPRAAHLPAAATPPP
jgi:hypothetical protein